MGSNWTLKKIGEFAEVKGGKRLPKGKRLSEKKTTHPYIRVVDFTDGRISLSNLLYVPEEVFPNIKRYIVESGDVVISIVGTIGLVATIPTELHEANLTENAAKILIEDTTVDSQYLSYYLKSSIGQHEIQRNTVGSTQPKLPLYGIKNIEVSYPPLPEQRAIAHILGSLDDKIELNRRMDKTLEAMARSIFKSWFVDFDPVHA
jgi:type I restriction enzyme S subunit